MTDSKKLLHYFIRISNISNDRKLSFDQRLQKILNLILSCLQVKSGSIMLRKGRKVLEVRASSNPELIGVQQSLDEECVSSWVANHKTPVCISDIGKNGHFQKKFGRYEKDAFLSVPIVSHDKTIGVLNVTDKIDRDIFAQEEQEILLNIAGHVISTLENQRLTEELKKKKKTLQQKNRKLRKLEKLKTELFNMLIHDLKGPISEVVANLDILSYTIDDKNREFVESAQVGCDTLLRMVSNLLDIAKLEEGKLNLLYEKINGRDLIKEAIARLFGLVKIKQLAFSEKFPHPEPEEELWGDRSLLLRVIQNLLSNAIEHSPQKAVISVGYCYPKPRTIEFFVEDQGPGIPPEYHEVIFDKYTQLEKKADGRIYTTGLGLAFCKVAVKAHRGKIGVQSQSGKGSRFYFVLPLGIKR